MKLAWAAGGLATHSDRSHGSASFGVVETSAKAVDVDHDKGEITGSTSAGVAVGRGLTLGSMPTESYSRPAERQIVPEVTACRTRNSIVARLAANAIQTFWPLGRGKRQRQAEHLRADVLR